ncbi:MAG: hypothetical protein QF546_06265 [Alphaproteobacteria bacterium]|jgi:hypothetical protein|nr:hypothetical protein [Alphaproteobacteria bacterium]HJP23050.1 hypothetical protein [Alphaproteobacteria bacterium]
MDERSLVFVEVMIAIAVVGVLAFLIYLITQYARRPSGAVAEGGDGGYSPSWYEFVLAAVLLLVVGAILVWQFRAGAHDQLAASDWRLDLRSLIFFIVMLVAAGLGLAVFVISVFVRLHRQSREAASATDVLPASDAAATAAPAAAVQTPSALRLLGLLGLAVAILLLNWIYLPRAGQYALILYFVYPATLGVALVLLFDKASRAWSAKSGAETVREWLFCDALTFLLFLGFLNLYQAQAGEKYAAMFWDFLAIAAFFLVFWLVDRKLTRYRFLVAYGYLIALPILLLIWEAVQEVKAPEGLSWWSTIWPFFGLAIIFFVLEIISLIATRGTDHQTVPAIKDGIFVVVYGILLIVAVPGAPV